MIQIMGQDGITVGSNTDVNASSDAIINYFFQRAPGFFDEVCYTGNGGTNTITHNLGVVPSFIIVKCRSAVQNWATYAAALGNNTNTYLSTSDASQATAFWNSTDPTSSVFTTNGSGVVGSSGNTYVAWLFATCPNVSKVGSYTGTGASQVINCGFTAGARFVLIKRTDDIGDWYVYDTTRGMVSGTDPYLQMDTATSETNANYVFTSSTGFTIQAAAPAAINASGGTFIFLAIA